jgi:hypothetical protein
MADFQMASETPTKRCGQSIECPHCHLPTQVYIEKEDKSSPEIIIQKSKPSLMMFCPICGNEISRRAWFCFKCGEFHYGLWRVVWNVIAYLGCIALLSAIFAWFVDWALKQLS